MKLARIIDPRFHAALNKLIASKSLPIKVAFKLKGISKKVQEEFSKYEEVRKTALESLGDKNEDGTLKVDEQGNVQFSGDALQQFAQQIGELVQEEIELPTIKLDDLANAEISFEDVEMLEGLVVE